MPHSAPGSLPASQPVLSQYGVVTFLSCSQYSNFASSEILSSTGVDRASAYNHDMMRVWHIPTYIGDALRLCIYPTRYVLVDVMHYGQYRFSVSVRRAHCSAHIARGRMGPGTIIWQSCSVFSGRGQSRDSKLEALRRLQRILHHASPGTVRRQCW
jgi:hypothetical protein